jgi:hypothetical protein
LEGEAFFLGLSAVLWLTVFLGGWAWSWWKSAQADSDGLDVVSSGDLLEMRAEAMRLLDEAVELRHEKRFDEAMIAARRAREVDPQLPSLDLLLAELAFQLGDTLVFHKFAQTATNLPASESGAKLLLALEHWRKRVVEGRGDDESGKTSADMLAEASSAQPSMDVTWFFRGDLLRRIGQPAAAHHALLASMHRQHPWRSAEVIGVKKRFTQLESTMVLPPSQSIASNFGLHPADPSLGRVEATATSDEFLLQRLAKTLTVKQWQWILSDQGMQGSSTLNARRKFDAHLKSMELNVPLAILPQPEPRLDYDF